MQIPGIGGQSGTSVAQAPQAVGVPLLDAGRGLQQIGNAGLQIAGEEAAYQRDLNMTAQRARTALALATTNNALHDAHDEVARGVMDGSIDPDKATGELQTRANKIKSTTLDGVLPEQRQLIEDNLTTTAGGLARSLNGVVIKRQQQDVGATIDQFGEQVSREAMRTGPQWAIDKYGAMVDTVGGSAGITPVQGAKLKQAFAEKTHASFFEMAGAGALAQGDDKALGDLVAKLQGPAGEPLDPMKRAQLTHQLYGWQQSVLAKQDRAANQAAAEQLRAENAAVDMFNKGADVALSGGYFSPEFITEMTTAAAGTKQAGPAANLIASQRVIAGFASQSADQRAAMLERARSARATPGQGTDPMGEKLLGAMTTMDAKLRTAAAENPWEAAQKAGVIQNAQQFDTSNPSTAAQVMQQRMAMIGQVEQWTGGKVSPLQPGEADKIGKMIRQMPVDQAATMLAGMGAAVGDADRVGALAKQLHDKDSALGLAMMYASAKTTEGRYTAELILRGDQALKDNTAMVDKAKETGWQGTIAKAVRGAYSNREAEDAYIDAAYKIAAANYAKDGSTDIDRAVRLATGGIIETGAGTKTPLPYGMKEDDFRKRIATAAAGSLATETPGGMVYVGRTPMPLADFFNALPKAGLVHAGQGRYQVKAGAGVTTNSLGVPIILKVQP